MNLSPTPKIKTLDFFSGYAHEQLLVACAYQDAWQMAVKARAPQALRRQLRFFMRFRARLALARVRKQLAADATENLRYLPQNAS